MSIDLRLYVSILGEMLLLDRSRLDPMLYASLISYYVFSISSLTRFWISSLTDYRSTLISTFEKLLTMFYIYSILSSGLVIVLEGNRLPRLIYLLCTSSTSDIGDASSGGDLPPWS